MLILFDVDLTLVDSNRAGMKALVEAGQAIFGERFHSDGVRYSGRLDPVIVDDLLEVNELPRSTENSRRLIEGYLERLPAHLDGRTTANAGVPELLAALAEADGVTLGLLSGNFRRSGLMKLEAAGITADIFRVHVWGDDSPINPPRREYLAPVALGRFRAETNSDLQPSRVTIVGDTVFDVDCAKSNGCRALGVATGPDSEQALAEAGADRTVPDLSDTEGLLRWLTQR